MIKNCLIHIMNPIGFIAAISAVETLHNAREVKVDIVVQWPGSEELSEEICSIVKVFAQKFPFIRKIGLKNYFYDKTKKYDEIYFPHDLIEGTSDILFKKNPQAKRICYGDSFGMVFKKESFFRSKVKVQKNLQDHFKNMIHSLFRRKSSSQKNVFLAHQAVLILPVDLFGDYLREVPLVVCQKKTVREVVQKCSLSSHQLTLYIQRILKKFTHRRIFLFLTENLTEGNFISLDREIDMYCEILKKHCRPSDIILIKLHPGEISNRTKKIQENLSQFQIIEVEKKLTRYPIEVWTKFLKRRKVISSSYPVLSLKYLYDIDVIQPMDDGFIEEWFPQESWSYLKEAIQLYMTPLKKLKNWDKKSILWSGGK